MSRNWFTAIIGRLFWLLLACLIIGLALGQLAWALVGLGIYLLHPWQTRRLQHCAYPR